MQVIGPQVARPRRLLLGSVVGTVYAAVLLATGVAIGYLAVATPFVTQFALTPRPGPGQVAAGVLGFAFALTAPGVFLIVGLARIVSVVEALRSLSPRKTLVTRHAKNLPDEYVSASRVVLPDGRIVPELVVGPFGIAVLEEMPPANVTRQTGGRWEVRTTNGRWIPLENPLERAGRDADRVRRWVADGDRDFVVKVYAAVVATDPALARTSTCAVVAPDQVPGWLASLAPQRSLSPTRRARLVELVRAAI